VASCCIEKSVPSCGDSIRLECNIAGPTLVDIAFEAEGCVISQAQASLVCQLVQGRELVEVRQAIESFLRWLDGGPWPDDWSDDEIRATEGTRKFPLRRQCLSLVWNALAEAMAQNTQKS
jgi:nitrogen fixation protein NifU and related proteins